ncbi:hypothetical protein [Bacillus sp. SG-1]|uniref:hypothetical protein n=1 Tax=Bacillus sp. SG-1 TaxID=161544 RepID=UPI000154336A|nr:hypothetical protein [Bacillus sp. SG-1]EDL66308.1 hypothetical protein BSG1_03110 [Bacillus sp. SG-1]
MKKWKLVLVMILLFPIGVLTGLYTSVEEATREIRVGYQEGGNQEVIRIEKVITNIEDQSAIDNIMMIYLNKEKIDPPYGPEPPGCLHISDESKTAYWFNRFPSLVS